MIPSGWTATEFGELVDLSKRRIHPQQANYQAKCVELEHIAQVTGKLIGYTDSTQQVSIKNQFRKGDVLFGKLRPYLRKYWFCEFDGVCSSEIWVFTPKKSKCDSKFLFYLVQTDKFIQIANVSYGSKMPRSDWGYVSESVFDIPPLPEQRKIAKILSTWDEAISRTERLIAALQQRKKGLMQRLLTGLVRFPGFEGEWKQERLSNKISLKHGYQFRNHDFVDYGIPVIKIGNVIGTSLDLSSLSFVAKERLEEFSDFVIHNGDILMSLTGNIGRVVEVQGLDLPLLQNYRVGKFYPKTKLYKKYMKHILSSPLLTHQLNKYANQSAQANFGKQDLDKLRMPIPNNLTEQRKIADVLDNCDKEIELQSAKLELLLEQKKGLMQRLLTGEIRITVDS